jgi:cyclophilin family peptidyl-prolyl cis-trans isomerase
VRIVIILLALLLFTPISKAEPSPMEQSFEGNPIVVINITYSSGIAGGDEFQGEIILELFLNWAPITVTNFIDLVNQSFYDGIYFHRIIDDFVIQSGDPNCKASGIYPVPISDASCGEGGSEDTIPLEINENLTHINGAIGMARGTDPDSASSQFYICDTSQHGLDNGNRTLEDDPGYAVFGVVREGIEFVQAAAAVPTTNNIDGGDELVPRIGTGLGDRPLYEVHINSIILREYLSPPATETEDEKIPGFNFSFAILSLVIITSLYRKK